MSELVNARKTVTNFRWQLLATASAIALLGAANGVSEVHAADNDSDRPILWIELGGQLSRLDDGQELFSPPVMAARPSMFSPSAPFEKLPLYSLDETGKLSFQPDGSDWVLSASVRYGRSGGDRHVRQQTTHKPFTFYYTSSGITYRFARYPIAAKFADTTTRNSESHAILDFQVGKDVGLGMFGARNGSSIFNLGVRFAQFATKSNIALKSDPDWHFTYFYFYGERVNGQPYHSNAATLLATRSFHGIGPSISWNASAPLMGSPQGSELTFDWGVNAAVLFGRQQAQLHHQTKELYQSGNYGFGGRRLPNTIYQNATHHTRSRSVTVPNVGGFAGASFRIQNFKVSAGYRADLFFGAMDGGIDAAKKENVGFYGPFASISVGLGG
jgi:hypothetical protein